MSDRMEVMDSRMEVMDDGRRKGGDEEQDEGLAHLRLSLSL